MKHSNSRQAFISVAAAATCLSLAGAALPNVHAAPPEQTNAAAAYCRSNGGVVRTRTPTFNTNNLQNALKLSGPRQFCEFTSKSDGSRIHIALDTLYTTEPTLAVLAYLDKPAVPQTSPNVNPASVYCSSLGGSDLFGGINAAGGGWVTDDKNTADAVVQACVFPDLSIIDSWGLAYHANGDIRGADLTKIVRYQPAQTPRVFRALASASASTAPLTVDRVKVDPLDLAASVTGTVVPATANNPNEPPQLNGAPEHLRFAFGDDRLSEEVNPRERQILIYPLDAYLNLYEGAERRLWSNNLITLDRLAIRRPEVVTETIPVVPAFNASQVFRSNVGYLQFPGGLGVRFVTGYAQDDIPFNNENIFYTFQGYTTDQKQRVSIFYPVTVKDWEGAKNAEEAAEFLETVAPDGFEPNLAALDAMVESLQILTPRQARTPQAGLAIGADQVQLDVGSLADEIKGETVAGVVNNPNEPPGMNGWPEHLKFGFGDEAVDTEVAINQRQLRIYPVDAYRDVYTGTQQEQFNADNQALANLINARPLTVTGPIPVLPYLGASQILQAQPRFLDAVSGAGIRFVTFYAQDPISITNEGLFYTYQGLTSDGKYHISLIYPIEAKDIPGVPSPEETTAYLDGLAPADFTPSLDELDAMMQSLRVGTFGATASIIPPQEITATTTLTFTPKIPEATREGVCSANSSLPERADAWQCTVGDVLYDPCFTAADEKTVVCGQAPVFTSDEDGFAVELTKPLPKAVGPSEQDDVDPWILFLQDGNLCVGLSGAASEALGKHARYGCLDGSVILGDPVQVGNVIWVDEVRAEEGPQSLQVTSARPSRVIQVWR